MLKALVIQADRSKDLTDLVAIAKALRDFLVYKARKRLADEEVKR